MRLNQRQTKRQILSLFANDFSCAEQPIFRTKIDTAKVDHLLNLITHPESVTTIMKPTVKDVIPWKM